VLLKRVFVTKKAPRPDPLVDQTDALKNTVAMFGGGIKKGIPEIVKTALGKE
jgi:hypothetical protein